MRSTLLLNADGTPTSLIPMSDISWQDACKNLYTGNALPLHFYDDWVVHSQKVNFQVPSVMILKRQVLVKRRLKCETGAGGDNPQPLLVFVRDGFICQYCNEKFSEKDLTIDHVIPRTDGGKTTWLNCTTACAPCNGRRGCDTRIQPRTKPFRPTYGHLVKMKKRFPINIPHISWNYYLGWREDLVNIVKPDRGICADPSNIFNDKRVKIEETA